MFMLQRKIEDRQDLSIDFSARPDRSVEKLPSVTEMISPEQERRFLKKLFSGDAAGYRQMLAQLEVFSNWAEAHHFLEDYFQRHGINPYNDEAVRFSDLVYRRYFPEDTYLYSVHAAFAQTDLRFLPFIQPAH
jgi:hypothetical protein